MMTWLVNLIRAYVAAVRRPLTEAEWLEMQTW